MLSYFETNASTQVSIRLCVFSDETEERGPAIIPLKRPPYLEARETQCVAKILAWLDHASLRHPASSFVGWVDSDTWFDPVRMATHLASVYVALPSGALAWGGDWQHWQRAAWDQHAPPTSLGGVGFSWCSPCSVSAWPETDPRLKRESRAAVAARSFAMTQGGLTYLSTAAARRLADNATAGAFGWAQREGAFEALKARWQPGRCSLVTDVAIGWLGARVFARSRLHAVEVSPNLEYYPWPLYRRFSARHALAVHGLKKAGAHAWFAEQASNASHVPPRLSCRASPWAHQRSASWRLCTSLSACDDPGVPLEPSIGQLRNFSVPWVPGAVRDLCKLHASGRLGRSRSGVRSRGAENFTRRAR
jgi:hypothetical protein